MTIMNNTNAPGQLAIHGGTPVRTTPFPGRRLFGEDELEAVTNVFRHAWDTGRDFGYQGPFEDEYVADFCAMQGGGFADAVSSGTSAVLIALAALELPGGSEIICSPVTDPGGLTPALWLGLHPIIADAAPGGFNVDAERIAQVLTPRTKALLLTHAGGIPIDMEPVAALAREHDLCIVEDCSQAHGARVNATPVGCFSDIAAFSTMFSKNHASGGCGGLVYTQDKQRYDTVRAFSDRGKPFARQDFDPKNPAHFLFPALNLNQDELSCAIGRSTLRRLPQTILRRRAIIEQVREQIDASSVLRILRPARHLEDSPFFMTVCVDTDKITCSKLEFARAVQAEGIPINPDYRYVVSEWPWLAPHCATPPSTPHAVSFRESSFNILFNERFSDNDAKDIATALLKVEAAMAGPRS
ncbi:glutamine--scyllo-inositol aminotransferase [Oceanidesulfovibrio marinus]|uniref:Glutamine--scyllo-inositol aminotransferase n=2 Tax=Oceanidesulfovibrio marinus TaxID=370038 RepID=A0ABX6NBT0_9BACT|nr:glutamine--scyllo-inositol aminotransferase [Oceanidesulfovibrio marinus]